jgi:hypothetical protein
MHLDLESDDVEAEVNRLEQLGATPAQISQGAASRRTAAPVRCSLRCAPVLTARGEARASHKRAPSRGQLAARGLYGRQARNTALAAFASNLPAPVMADLLGMRINTAVTWGQTMKREWYSFVAAKILGQQADSGTRDPVT